jgi:hypothetical protein
VFFAFQVPMGALRRTPELVLWWLDADEPRSIFLCLLSLPGVFRDFSRARR